MPPLIREFLSSLDDKEWQSELYKLLQNQSFNQVEVDLFELLCKVLDHNLFAQVDWARNSYYFKELKVGKEDKNSILRKVLGHILIITFHVDDQFVLKASVFIISCFWDTKGKKRPTFCRVHRLEVPTKKPDKEAAAGALQPKFGCRLSEQSFIFIRKGF